MKKLLIGCLVILVLGGVLLAVGAYMLYRAASPVMEDARNYLRGMAELGELEKDIVKRVEYAPPSSGELTEAQMERFVRVQDGVRAALGQRMTEIEEQYKHLKANAPNAQQPTMSEALGALREIASVFVQARRYQIDALNREGFSQSEYSWVRDRVFQAAGVEVTHMIDLQRVERAIREGTGISTIGAPRGPRIDVPEKNRALVKPYLGRMDNWIPLAFFGL